MNFVARNLGWILLLFFFLFMLFVISTNDPAKNNIQNTSEEQATEQSSEENLDSIISELEKTPEISEITMSEETQVGEEMSISENKKGFFSFFNFGKNNDKKEQDKKEQENQEETEQENKENKTLNQEEEIQQEETEEESENKIILEEGEETEQDESLFTKLFGERTDEEKKLEEEANKQEEQTESEESDTVKNEEAQSEGVDKQVLDNTNINNTVAVTNIGGNITKSTGKNLVENASYAFMYQYPEIVKKEQEIKYPGLNLETKVGKEFEVGVHMLKLNNANFDVKLALMNHGDRLKQLTAENQYGCFMIEILEAQNPLNIGKTGYVCKKYLQEASEKLGDTKYITPENIPTSEVKIETIQEEVLEIEKRIENTEPTIELQNTESFLPEEPVIIPNRSNESFLPQEPSITPNSEIQSFLPIEEPKF